MGIKWELILLLEPIWNLGSYNDYNLSLRNVGRMRKERKRRRRKMTVTCFYRKSDSSRIYLVSNDIFTFYLPYYVVDLNL
jgi:hypothetical protein